MNDKCHVCDLSEIFHYIISDYMEDNGVTIEEVLQALNYVSGDILEAMNEPDDGFNLN